MMVLLLLLSSSAFPATHQQSVSQGPNSGRVGRNLSAGRMDGWLVVGVHFTLSEASNYVSC